MTIKMFKLRSRNDHKYDWGDGWVVKDNHFLIEKTNLKKTNLKTKHIIHTDNLIDIGHIS